MTSSLSDFGDHKEHFFQDTMTTQATEATYMAQRVKLCLHILPRHSHGGYLQVLINLFSAEILFCPSSVKAYSLPKLLLRVLLSLKTLKICSEEL